jgi:sigma-B regulation protein RsbU (phosphoserine phosphatase)
VSRRGLDSGRYRITRSSRYQRDFNPWKQRDQIPVFSGGLLAEIAYANKPYIIDDLRVEPSDPAFEFLHKMKVLVALPQYDNHEGLNISVSMWDDPSKLDRDLLPMIHWQSNLFGRATLNMVLKNQLAEAYASLDRELELVGRMQRALLPRQLPTINGISLAAHYETARRAGGDFYDLFPMADGSCGLLIGDVSGHGTPAAVMMAITHTLVHAHPGEPAPPAQVMARLNQILCRRYTRDSGAFVTAFYGILSRDRRAFRYSAAGHNPPRRICRAGAQAVQLADASALPLGIDAEAEYIESDVPLAPADALVLYTDGIVEAMNAGGELFGYPRLDEALTVAGAPEPGRLIRSLIARVDAFRGGRPFADDRTVLAAVVDA